MKYISTRNQKIKVSAAEAILSGIADDGGLFVPESFEELVFPTERLIKMSNNEISAKVLELLFGGEGLFGVTASQEEEFERIKEVVAEAYDGYFEGGDIAPLVKVGDSFVLELHHGPTAAFKDVALRLLPRLLTAAKKALGETAKTLILTATSGDTGSAALSGFADVEGVDIIVFYPKNGTSAVQERQMVSVSAENTLVVGIRGNFDDAQSGVKEIFSSLSPQKVRLSSANSINIGRLAPQIAYYFKAYRDLLLRGEISFGERVDFVVPTGNFGDILAGYFARRMGLFVGKLISASNSNRVLSDFFESGVYDIRREFVLTRSPSMDILISSNLERLIYFVSGDSECREYMSSLKEKGFFTLEKGELAKIKEIFDGGFCDDEDTLATISDIYKENGYLCDTHTAVAMKVAEKLEKELCEKRVVLSTASPFKFSKSVLKAISPSLSENIDEFEAIDRLEALTGNKCPSSLKGIKDAKVCHELVIDKSEMKALVEKRVV